MSMEKKTCRKCKKSLPLDSYYVHSQMADGHLNICIECTKRRVEAHREANLDEIRAYDRLRGRTEKRKKKCREYAAKHPQKMRAGQERWLVNNIERRRVHIKLGSAVRSGRIVRASKCSECGKVGGRIEAHHPDYSRPFDVIWLCRQCHAKLHRKYTD